MCLTNHYEDIPQRDLITDCSLEHGVDFDKLNDCVSRDDGEHGIELLRESVNRTANAGVTKSCTIRLNKQIRTVRDGGRWKDYEGGHDVEELISDIKRLYQASDEDWVPRRVPQPANAKASKSKTAKTHKATKIATLYDVDQKGQESSLSLIEFELTASDKLTDPAGSDTTFQYSTPFEPTIAFGAVTATTPSFLTLISSTLNGDTTMTPAPELPPYQTPDFATHTPTESLTAYETPETPVELTLEY